jgi:RNA polymerase sigma-70 factor (ECF subfamily)
LILREVEDRDLILRAREGDVDGFNVLVSRWERKVYNYLLRAVRNREDALDLCQETFLKAYRNLKSLQDPARFAQWLFRIAHNESISLFRKRRFDSDEEVPEVGTGGAVGVAGTRIELLDLGLAVENALGRLTPEQREVVILKIYQGFKFHEIAEIIGSPASTVKSRLYTALEILKDVLAPVAPTQGARTREV